VREAGSERERSHHATAVAAACMMARNQESEVVVHAQDGRIVRHSHGAAPLSPRGGGGGSAREKGASASKDPVSEIKKAIDSLRPEEQTAIRQWMDSKRQRKRPKTKSPVRWPDFQTRQKAIFGNRVLPDSQAVLDEIRADRF
jgi:hypothetical protein